MSVTITLDISAEEFPLSGALAANPGIHIHLERVIPLGETVIPYFWVADDTVEAIETALRRDTDIASFTVVDSGNGDALVRVEWAHDLDGFLGGVIDTGGMFLEASGESETWTVQLRFNDHDDLTAFYRQCVERDIPIEVQRVHSPQLPAAVGSESALTDVQYETLVTALEKGYFDIPRRIDLVDLAAEIGVSDTAVSQRLRRAIVSHLGATLLESGDDAAITDE